jgi:hypothetical protein
MYKPLPVTVKLPDCYLAPGLLLLVSSTGGASMNSTTKRTLTILAVLLTFAGFQNCSKYKFAALGGDGSNKGQNTPGLEDEDFPPTDDIPPENDNEVSTASCAEFVESSADVSGVADVVIRKHRGDLVIDDALTLELGNIRGAVFARTEDAGHLKNMREGDLCLVSSKEGGGSLNHLNNHRGNIEIVNMHSGQINNTQGTLTIRGGSFESINNHRGDVVLIGVAAEDEGSINATGVVTRL